MLYGKCPFRLPQAKAMDAIDPKKGMDRATLEWEPPYDEVYFSSNAKDLIQRLLNKDPSCRLGHGGAQEIKKHPWFRAIDWDLLSKGLVTPTWKPSCSNLNIGRKDDVEDMDFANNSLTDVDDAIYKDWNYSSTEAFSEEIVDLLMCEEREEQLQVKSKQSKSKVCVVS